MTYNKYVGARTRNTRAARRLKKLKKLLGIGVGAARHRLYIKIIRAYYELTKNMECNICGVRIEPSESFHIDHKGGWENLEEFLDLNICGPSHPRCNVIQGAMAKWWSDEEILARIKQPDPPTDSD